MKPLPLLRGHFGRSALTCQYRCGNACAHPAPNESGNEYFSAEVSRRGLIRAGALGALVVGAASVGGTASPAGADADDLVSEVGDLGHEAAAPGRLTFTPIPPNQIDRVIVPNGYDHSVLIGWGDPVEPGAPPFDIANQTPQAQARQFGTNADYVAVVPLDRRFRRALLVVNHEYTTESLMFPGFTTIDAMSVSQIEIAMAAHGMSVAEIERVRYSSEWRLVTSGHRRYNRRITLSHTRFEFTGPAAGSALLKTSQDPSGTWVIGTQNNCAGGLTPWGTVLSGEENFNNYFVGADGVPDAAKPALKRYGFDITKRYPSGSRKWDRADARFDLTAHPNEAHRFGWVVEVDPLDPRSTPRKHTALGRFKHEGANITVTQSGRVVAYSGDDERFDYLYKFVSKNVIANDRSPVARRHNMTLLESGTLYVAKFDFTSAGEIDGSGKLPSDGAFNGTGRWIPLVRGNTSLVDGFTAEEALVFTRLAADNVGATKLDRPEDVEPHPHTGKVYAAFTNNTNRGKAGFPAADEVNPRTDNKFGHIVEITEDGGDNTSETFTWTVPIVCGDPRDPSTFFMGFDKSQVSPIACPDNVAFDGAGNLWLATDSLYALPQNDGLFAVALDGPEKGWVRQFLSVPFAAEACGPFIAQDNRSVFLAVQHPGEVDGASVENPASTWPHGDFARSSVVVCWRRDGRAIGV